MRMQHYGIFHGYGLLCPSTKQLSYAGGEKGVEQFKNKNRLEGDAWLLR